MKFLKILNTVALTIPLVIAMFGFVSEEYFILSLVSTMATGFLQLIAGIFYWYEFPKSIPIKIYFILVSVFFLLLFLGIGKEWIWILPPSLCIYLSTLIYTKKSTI